MNCPTLSSPHYSQSWNFLQHLQTAALFRKAEILSNLATCLATSIPDIHRTPAIASPTSQKRIAFDWQSLNFDSAKPQHRYIKSVASWHQLSPGVDGTCPSDFPKESNPCVTLFNASFVLVLILCPAMGLCDSWIAVSRKDATRCHLQEIQHLQAQAMSQKPQLWESNLCTEQEKQVCRSNAFYSEKSQWDEGKCIVKIHDKKERMQIYRLKPTPFLFFKKITWNKNVCDLL